MLTPCIKQCHIGEDMQCSGCGRTLEEIKNWSWYAEETRRAIIWLCEQRKKEKVSG